jgi:hypothetical protein
LPLWPLWLCEALNRSPGQLIPAVMSDDE